MLNFGCVINRLFIDLIHCVEVFGYQTIYRVWYVLYISFGQTRIGSVNTTSEPNTGVVFFMFNFRHLCWLCPFMLGFYHFSEMKKPRWRLIHLLFLWYEPPKPLGFFRKTLSEVPLRRRAPSCLNRPLVGSLFWRGIWNPINTHVI